LQKFRELLCFFKSSAPCIERNLRDVGKVTPHISESLRSLIRDVRMFLDMVNIVAMSFEIPLLPKELYCSWSSLSVSARGQKKTNCTIRVDIKFPLEDDKTSESLQMLTRPLDFESFIRSLFSSEFKFSEFESFRSLYSSEFGPKL